MPSDYREQLKERRKNRDRKPRKLRNNVISTHFLPKLENGETFFRFLSPKDFDNIQIMIFIGQIPDGFEGEVEATVYKSDGSNVIFTKSLVQVDPVVVLEIEDIKEKERIAIGVNLSGTVRGVWVTISSDA